MTQTRSLEPDDIRLLQQLLAHDSGVLSIEELDYRNTDLDGSSIEDRLCELKVKGLIRKIEAHSSKKGIPNIFWTATDGGMNQLKEAGFYDGITILAEADCALERTDRIREIEEWDGRPTV